MDTGGRSHASFPTDGAGAIPDPAGEILLIPFHDLGHIFPATELALRLVSRGYRVTLFLPSYSPSPTPHPLINIRQYPLRPPQPTNPDIGGDRPPPPPHPSTNPAIEGDRPPSPPPPPINPAIEDYIHSSTTVSFAIIDVMMNHLLDHCHERGIPAVVLFTSSACSASFEYVARSLRRTHHGSLDDPLVISGLPAEMAITAADLRRRPRGPPPPPPPSGATASRGPPRNRQGLAGVDAAVALAFNTCEDLERPFLEYVSACTGKPTWGVGPLLAAGLNRDESNRGEPDPGVLAWLDKQPAGSVLYVCFGTRVGHTEQDLAELEAGLAESGCRFVWVVRGAGPPAGEVGRGLVVRGWAPQLLILGHPAIGGFLTHCGWNSTMEALGCGVPMLTWPVAGDQNHNSRLVTRWLRVGAALGGEEGRTVTRKEVVTGIEIVMGDEGLRVKAEEVRGRLGLDRGIPRSSEASLDALLGFLAKREEVRGRLGLDRGIPRSSEASLDALLGFLAKREDKASG